MRAGGLQQRQDERRGAGARKAQRRRYGVHVQGIAHAVFASRRGLLPAVRVFIDFLAERLPKLLEAARLECSDPACLKAKAKAKAGSKPVQKPL